jgi:predicted nuclease of predicted toxin-antitoxin system
MKKFMDDEIESEILQMFACNCVDKIRVEPRANKNQQDEEVQASSTQKDIITVESTCEVPSTDNL